MEVTIAYARANIKKLLKAVADGERATIMKGRKQPVADLVPPQPKQKVPRFGTLAYVDALIDAQALEPITAEQVERFIETGEY